jgi:hypothetical protein
VPLGSQTITRLSGFEVPLFDRPFMLGVHDGYAIVRDRYGQNGKEFHASGAHSAGGTIRSSPIWIATISHWKASSKPIASSKEGDLLLMMNIRKARDQHISTIPRGFCTTSQ